MILGWNWHGNGWKRDSMKERVDTRDIHQCAENSEG
jgi:hypothetical protein